MNIRTLLSGLLLAGILGGPWGFAQDDEVSRLKERIIEIQNYESVGFRKFIPSSQVKSYGSYVPLADNKIRQGDVIFFYFEPKNVFTKTAGGTYENHYTLDMTIQTEKQQVLYKKETILEVHDQSSSPRLDLHGYFKFTLEVIAPGKYLVKATIHDKLKGQSAEITWPFEVVK